MNESNFDRHWIVASESTILMKGQTPLIKACEARKSQTKSLSWVRQRTKKLCFQVDVVVWDIFLCTGPYTSALVSPVIATVRIEERVAEISPIANRSPPQLHGGQLSVASQCHNNIWIFIGDRRPLIWYLGLNWRLLPRQQIHPPPSKPAPTFSK